MHLKSRLLALVIIGVSAFLLYINWHQLNTEGKYSFKMAAFAPLGIIGGLFLLAFPTRAGRPVTTSDKIIVFAVFIIGLAAGLLNWYLMDPGFFGR